MAAIQTAFQGQRLAAPLRPATSAGTSRRASVVSPVAATRILRQVKVIEPFTEDKKGTFRGKVVGEDPDVKLLTRVQELRLLSKAEEAGLLSLAESFGLSLSAIEKYGLLSKAEELGVLSAATDPETPGKLSGLALGLLALGPAAVYLIPDDNPAFIVAQVLVALVAIGGGAAAYGASQLIATLQKR